MERGRTFKDPMDPDGLMATPPSGAVPGPGLFKNGAMSGRRCRAVSKQRRAALPLGPASEWQCKKLACEGYDVCEFHGGSTPKKYKGRYSEQMTSLRASYERALQDDALMDLREPLALADTLLQRCVKRAEERDVPEFRKRIFKLLDDARSLAHRNPQESVALIGAAHKLAKEGVDEDRALKDLREAASDFAGQVEGAWRTHLAQAQAVNMRDLVGILAQFVDIVAQECGPQGAVRVAERMQGRMPHLMTLDTQDKPTWTREELEPEPAELVDELTQANDPSSDESREESTDQA